MNYLRYGAVFSCVALGAALLIAALNTQVNTTLGSSAQLMVPAMIAALVEGQQHARHQKRKAGLSAHWRFAWIATALATGLNVALAYLAAPIAPEFGKLAIAPALSGQFVLLLCFYAGGYLICNWFFFGIGQGNQLSLIHSRGEIE